MRNVLWIPVTLWVGVSLVGCSKSSDSSSSSSSPVAVSGTLNATANSARIMTSRSSVKPGKFSDVKRLTDPLSSASVTYSDYRISCVTKTVPPVETIGTISSTGAFNLSVTGGLNQPMECNIIDSSDDVVAAMVVENSSKKDLNGNSEVNGAPAFSKDAALGTVSLDTTEGNAVVSHTAIADAVLDRTSSLSDSELFDPTGTWQIAGVDFTLPKGVGSTCPQSNNNNDCNGPPEGMKLYMRRLKGLDSSSGATVYGIQIWEDQNGNPKGKMEACGSMTGLSASDQTRAGVDLSAYGAQNGAFTFATTITDPNTNTSATITNGYKLSTATAQWTMPACVAKTKVSGGVTHNLWVCGPDSSGSGSPGGRYQANLGGGCVDSSGNAVTISNWSSVSWGSCSSVTPTIAGFYKNSCTATYNSQTITCSNEWGTFDDVNLTTASGSNAFNYASVANLMTSGQSCSAVSDAVAQANCYASYYQQHIDRDVNACLPRINVDWSATSAANFVEVDFRPQNLVFMEKLTYSDATHGAFLTQKRENWGVQVKNSSGQDQWINCGVIDKGGLSFVKVSPTKMMATYISATTTTSIDKPACVGASWNGRSSKFIFYLNKI